MLGASHEAIAERAYVIWLGEGRPESRSVENWQQAETEILFETEVLLTSC